MEEEKKEAIEVEVVEKDATEEKAEEKKEEKKEGSFSKWWKKTKDNVNNSILESNIESAYNKAHAVFEVYPFEGTFLNSTTVHGEIVDGKLVYFGEDEIKEFSVIIERANNKAYYAGQSTKVEVEATYEGVNYTRPGTSIALDENVEEVKVIKANSRYFIYKGNTEK